MKEKCKKVAKKFGSYNNYYYLCNRKRKQGTKIGALDERFSLWSAKPAKAVRLRHAPQQINLIHRLMCEVFLFITHF